MHDISAETAAAFQRMTDRNLVLDAQLPDHVEPFVPDPALVIMRTGRVEALAASQLSSVTADDSRALWGACRTAELQLLWGGDASAVDELLERWISESAPQLGEPGDWESSLQLKVPSRDSELVQPLLARGFAPVGISGIRVERPGSGKSGHDSLAALTAASLELRPATIEDAPLLAEMDAELLQHDTQHGSVSFRAGAADTLRTGIEERLALDPDWSWVILQDGAAVGYVSVETNRERHLSQCASGGKVAYIQAMYLRTSARGGGLGEAVVDVIHDRLSAAGFSRILLSYAALNPRSGPFWTRMGYRPLWTNWQRRPARQSL